MNFDVTNKLKVISSNDEEINPQNMSINKDLWLVKGIMSNMLKLAETGELSHIEEWSDSDFVNRTAIKFKDLGGYSNRRYHLLFGGRETYSIVLSEYLPNTKIILTLIDIEVDKSDIDTINSMYESIKSSYISNRYNFLYNMVEEDYEIIKG